MLRIQALISRSPMRRVWKIWRWLGVIELFLFLVLAPMPMMAKPRTRLDHLWGYLTISTFFVLGFGPLEANPRIRSDKNMVCKVMWPRGTCTKFQVNSHSGYIMCPANRPRGFLTHLWPCKVGQIENPGTMSYILLDVPSIKIWRWSSNLSSGVIAHSMFSVHGPRWPSQASVQTEIWQYRGTYQWSILRFYTQLPARQVHHEIWLSVTFWQLPHEVLLIKIENF
jgi:hypothetical protein